jgi:pilus assembly protein CpaB
VEVVEATPTPSASAAPPPVEKVEALYARKRIPRYTFLDANNIIDFVTPRKNVPKNVLPPKATVMKDLHDIKGFIVLDDINQDEPILRERLAKPAEIGGVSFHIDKGKRAVTVRIDKVRGVAGFVSQGDSVDVMGTFTIEGQPLTRIILQSMKVLAVNSVFINPEAEKTPASPAPEAQPPPEGGAPRNAVTADNVELVTFEATPDQAEKLVLSSAQARLYLALRSPGDLERVRLPGVDDVDLYLKRERKDPVPKVNVLVFREGPRPSVVPVRVEKVTEKPESMEGLNIYLGLEEEPIRDLKNEEF